MHELSVAESIIQIAEAAARKQRCRSIETVRVRLGEFTTVVPEALQFAFEAARAGTLAAEARLEIEFVSMILFCASCGEVPEPVRQICLRCPHCGLPLEIVAGEELQVDYIEATPDTEKEAWTALM